MKKIKGVQEIVHKILKEQPATRGDDFLLVLEVFKHYIPKDFNLEWCLINHNKLGLPSFASIIRTRRKLQVQHEELVAPKTVQQLREVKRGEFVQYALDIEAMEGKQ